MLLAKPRSRMETVNDLDGDLMAFWRVLRDQPRRPRAGLRPDATRPCRSAWNASPLSTSSGGTAKAPKVLLYIDPPYLGSTRYSGGYRHEMKTEADHRELAASTPRQDRAAHDRSVPEVLWSNRLPEPNLFSGAA